MRKLTFGEAIAAMKNGHAVQREGWNGKNMSVYLNKGNYDNTKTETPKPAFIDGVNSELFESGAEGTTTRMPNINMVTATGSIVTGWLASQTDMLAEDWSVL